MPGSTSVSQASRKLVQDRVVFIILCFVAGLAAGWCGWIGRTSLTWLGGIVATAALTVVFSVDAVNNPENDGLWVVGAIMVVMGAPIGFAAVAGAAHWLRRYQSGQQTR